MAEKNVQLKNSNGDLLYPKTKSANILNDSGEALGSVESGAQVNKIETISLNGVELSIVNKAVDITVSEPEYSVTKLTTAEDGYSATYQLTKDGTAVGEKINIPKDMVVQSGSVKTTLDADSPVEGYVSGDKYIDLVLANADNSHIYIKVSDLVDTYTAGTGIVISGNIVSINTSYVATKSEVSKKQDSLTTAQLAAVNSGITTAKVTTYDGYADTIALKADKATTLAGYGITDGVTYTELA